MIRSIKQTNGRVVYLYFYKAALEIFTQSLSRELENTDIKVITFHPGKVETPMQVVVRNSSPEDLLDVEVFKQSYVNNENYTPEYVTELLMKLINSDIVSGGVYKARDLVF